MKTFALFSILSAAFPAVYSHALILAVNGDNGVSAAGFAVVGDTPRDCDSRGCGAEDDTSVIRDDEIEDDDNEATACGRTESGAVDIASNFEVAKLTGMPRAAADGSINMTVHQVNGDGAGPFECALDVTGTGQTFTQSLAIIQNVPGDDSRSDARAQDFTLIAQMPATTKCGGPGGACLVRCRNNANAGPFGSCAAVLPPKAKKAASKAKGTTTKGAAAGAVAGKAATKQAGKKVATKQAAGKVAAKGAKSAAVKERRMIKSRVSRALASQDD